MTAAVRLADLPVGAVALDAEDWVVLIDTASTLLADFYAHLALKRARYAADPVQRLRLLRQRCGTMTSGEIHRELARIFTELRDAHTRYVGPAGPDRVGRVAVLPFLVEEYTDPTGPTGPTGERRERRYVVSKVADRSMIPVGSGFTKGVEATFWNGIPFARAVEIISEGFTGSHPDARRARGLESLTLRSLQYGPPPDELWVDIGFRHADGREGEVRLDWWVLTPQPPSTSASPQDPNPAALALGVDHEGESVQRAKADLYGRPRRATRPRAARARPTGRVDVRTRLPGAVAAARLDSPLGPLGYLRLWNFAVEDHTAYVTELRRLLDRLPDRGLIIDVRSNPGGLVWAAERVHQLLTPTTISPTRFSLPVTDLTVNLAANDALASDLGPWRASLEQAVSTGELYSQPIPLTDPARCNDIGQCYGGPVVCIADARTYSAGDLFAAGFVDNNIGPLITVGAATGGGGANVWTFDLLQTRLAVAGTPPHPLPDGCGFTFSFRRATRAGANEGRPIEDVGVSGHVTYEMTRQDLLDSNRDLLAAAVDLLAMQRLSRLRLRGGRGATPFTVVTEGIDRVQVTFDGTPRTFATGGRTSTEVKPPRRWQVAAFEGWGDGQLLQRRQVTNRG